MGSTLQKLTWTTQQRKPNDLNPLSINPRKISEEERNKLIESLNDFNLVEIPVINEDGTIIAGHQRITSLQIVGRGNELIDVRVPNRQLTDHEVKRYNLLSNTHSGEFDFEILNREFKDIDFASMGITPPEIEQLEPAAIEIKEEDDIDDIDEYVEQIQTDIVLGDIFQIGPHKLLCGDSTQTDEWKKIMGEEMADIIMTDPPYNVNYESADGRKIDNDSMSNKKFYQFLYDALTAVGAFTKPGGAIYIWHADSEGINFRTAMVNAGFLYKQCLMWVKNSFAFGMSDYHWRHEPCLYGWKEGAAHYFTDDRTNSTVIEDNLDYKKMTKQQLIDTLLDMKTKDQMSTVLRHDKPLKNDLHPTMKPIKLLAPLISNSSRPGEIVADGFIGSGSTMVASHQKGRVCRSIELSPKFCQATIDRMQKLFPGIEVKKLN